MEESSRSQVERSGAVSKSRWPSWAPVPNKPTVSVDVKQHFNQRGGETERGGERERQFQVIFEAIFFTKFRSMSIGSRSFV